MTQTESFGEMNFGHAELGDRRRTKRMVKLVDLMCQRPGGTLPQKLVGWYECRWIVEEYHKGMKTG